VLITVDSRDRRPIYQQVADGIRALIAGGKLVEGQSLPPVRQLAADLGVNLNTIAAAYRELRDDGLITLKHGSRASVALRTSAKQGRQGPRCSQDELRRPLRSALTKMVLAGLRRGDILDMVHEELRSLVTGTKS